VGAGVTALQTSANPMYRFWAEGSSSIRLNLAQAFNSIGGTLAPIVAGAFILTDPAKMARKQQWQTRCEFLHSDCRGTFPAGPCSGVYAPAHIESTQEFRPGKEGDRS